MDKLNKDYFLTQLKIYLVRGLANAEQGNNDEVIINYGKCKFIKDLLLRVYNFDLETEEDRQSKYLMNLYTELYYKF